MSTTMERANQLRDHLEVQLGPLVDLVTIDGAGVKPSTRAALVIFPPEISFPTFHERETTWKLAAVAAPADRPVIAWEALDKILDRLQEIRMNIATASPGSFDLAGAGSLPAYEITLNPE